MPPSTSAPRRTSSRRKTDSSAVYIVLLPVVFILGLAAGYLLWGQKPAVPDVQAQGRIDVSADDDPAFGPGDAPILIIEFSDYQCPYCKVWHDQVFDRLMANYPGQIRFVYRDFPLGNHPEAAPAADAANCAGEQDAFWEFHAALFSMQYGLNAQAYQQYAANLNLDLAAFNTCIQSNRYELEMAADLQYAQSIGVQVTPTFFINGIKVEGAQPYEVFKTIIDQELAQLEE